MQLTVAPMVDRPEDRSGYAGDVPLLLQVYINEVWEQIAANDVPGWSGAEHWEGAIGKDEAPVNSETMTADPQCKGVGRDGN